ncbi:MAG TPA: SurA N-terminal domain-containing protein [Thermoanaerobaculia bacterium]|nr:SurA N-terminal domain-containing protein [Thermoanaerobaculia bacterium]
MKKVLAILCLFAAAAASAAELVERVVARVNDAIITQSALDARVNRAHKDPQAPTDVTKLRVTVLEQMIRQKLIEGKAAKLDIVATPEEVDEAMERVKTQYGLTSEDDFTKALQANGIDRDQLREQLRESLLTNKVLAREVPINLNDDALRTEYEKVKEQKYSVPQKASVAEILVRFDPNDAAGKEAAKAKIEAARVQVAGGKPFLDVASSMTEGPARDRGGALGLVTKGDLTPDLDQAIFATSDSLVGPVELKNGWALLSITDREKAGFRPFDEVKEEIRKRMSEDIYDKKFADYLADLRKNAIVKIVDKDLAAEDEAQRKSGS